MAFIIKPLVTEKMTKITDKSSVDRTYRVKSKKGEEKRPAREMAMAVGGRLQWTEQPGLRGLPTADLPSLGFHGVWSRSR